MLKSLVRKIIDMFGFSRCTVACNRHVNAAVADGGGVQASWCQMQCVIRNSTKEQPEWLFACTTNVFYRFEYTRC